MKKYRMRPTKSGKNIRMSYSSKKEVLDMPNLIGIQVDSYDWFIHEGLEEIFRDISPIRSHDAPGAPGSSAKEESKFELEFFSPRLCLDEIKYTIEQCKERKATYQAPLKVTVFLRNKATEEINQHEIFMGDMPLMTETGTFVINGAERVIVSQLVRSPGIYYGVKHDKTGKPLFSCTVIPNRGAWLEYETDANDCFWVKVDRGKKVPITVLIRSLLLLDNERYEKKDGNTDQKAEPHWKGTDDEIRSIFGNEPKIEESFKKDGSQTCEEGIVELYKKMRPGDPINAESGAPMLRGVFYDLKKYDLSKVGRYKFNKKLAFVNRIVDMTLAEDVIHPLTGEVLCSQGEILSADDAKRIQDAAVPFVEIQTEMGNTRVLSNMMVDSAVWLGDRFSEEEIEEMGIKGDVYYPVLRELLETYGGNQDVLSEEIRNNKGELIPKHITMEDIFASINYNIHLEYGIGSEDDIDHLGNRRIRAVGELLQNQYRVGISRMERVVRERMQTQDAETVTPQSLINIKPVTSAIKEFFGSSQLSQFMDQNNPLSELTHKRRLSALGPGGLSRDRAGVEVRDVHYTHYGRMCPIETPEGPNIGLINSLATYARINEYGFIETPYQKVIPGDDPDNPIVTDEVVYMTADEEDKYIVAQASEPLDKDGHFVRANVAGRFRDNTSAFPRREINFMDVSPRMVFSVATSMVPFLQNDDTTRALMGSNMQRQAVPLLKTDSPVVGTGMEERTARDSGVCIVAKRDGVVEISSGEKIVIRTDDGDRDEYKVFKFVRSNQGNCMSQRPIVLHGDRVKAGDVIADGTSTSNGELALGKNPLIGFMTWEGYNYEDAVLLSERLVKEDVYTSIHIESYETVARDTKLGAEVITRELPGHGSDALLNLDENGIVRKGAEVRAGDILVGKLTPKGEQELSPEEKLLRAIFGEKAKETRDTSLRLPHGGYGVVMDTRVFTRENGDELPPGVNQSVIIYIAQKRKISVGDKMAGRHGNKGVVSRILPVEDMPFLPNGRPLDIVLNPLGVPSRMNIGQVLELHLGLAAQILGFKVSTPIFDGANEKDITAALEMANDYANTEWEEFNEKYKDQLEPEVLQYLYENRDHREEWKGVEIDKSGKVELRDGRTGEAFPSKVSVGFMHYLKLHHLVDDKIHARSTGPYALVTQQPLGGKAQFGGQRFGEMEVWALEAYGAAYTLQEILTVKSDDTEGRVKAYEAITKGLNVPKPSIPESFKVMLKEFQGLCLDVEVLDEDDNPVRLEEIENRNEDDGGMREAMIADDSYAGDAYVVDEGDMEGYGLSSRSEDEIEYELDDDSSFGGSGFGDGQDEE